MPPMLSLAQWTATIHPGDRLRIVSKGGYWRVASVRTEPYPSITVRQNKPRNQDGHAFEATEENGFLQGIRHLQESEPPFTAPPPSRYNPVVVPDFTADAETLLPAPYTRQQRLPATITPDTRRPRRAAVYRAFDVHSVLLYAGYSTNPVQRLKQHAATAPWWALVSRTTVEWFDSTTEAARAERDAILTELPLYNARGATHPYISPVRNPA